MGFQKEMTPKLGKYLQDPFLKQLYSEIREAGPLRSISVDLTHECNLRCVGCYYFSEKMEQQEAPEEESEFEAFIEREKARGTNFVTIVGGEPSLELPRLTKNYDNFWMNVATNGLPKIRYEGLENMPIGVPVWGDHDTDNACAVTTRSISSPGLCKTTVTIPGHSGITP